MLKYLKSSIGRSHVSPLSSRLSIFFLLLVSTQLRLSAQSTFAPLNEDYHNLIERYEIKSGILSNLHTTIKPVRRKELVKLTTELESDEKAKLSKTDRFNLAYLQNDSWEWLDDAKLQQSDSKKPLWQHLFRKKADCYSTQTKDIDFHVSPIFQFAFANDDQLKETPYINTRGIELRGTLNKKLGFYSMLTENQMLYPEYVREYGRQYKANPYEGFTKVPNADSSKYLTDFFSARGYITFQALKNMHIQFGHDKNFIGSGVRSMILSDFSAPYLHLKVTTNVGRFQYMNLFAQMINKQIPVAVDNTEQIPPKYLSLHHLSVNIGRNLNIGIFESIVFGKRQVGFDINYLNPVILLRFVEGHLGSVDNSIAGANFKLNFKRHFSLYGQFVLDEFNIKYFKQDGWWAKKYAAQIGGRYVDVLGIKNLDFQTEYNLVRPYMYSHNSTYSNYVNYNLPLAHPLGANFTELLLIGRYQPTGRLFLNFTAMLAQQGKDSNIVNWGGDILRNYNFARPSEYGNEIGQGRRVNTKFYQLGASYMIAHNLFADLKIQSRNTNLSGNTADAQNLIFSAGLRWNTSQRSFVF
ncbi:capsule assembly Wzi family protein [Emticicia sp.]|uniref:capsule assembly Wzi family protein n=1 Tax=Emticicia sp. TaxID=1930953 RepID=UPI003BA84AB2